MRQWILQDNRSMIDDRYYKTIYQCETIDITRQYINMSD